MTYNKNLPDLKGVIDTTWEHLKINPATHAKFEEKPILCYINAVEICAMRSDKKGLAETKS